MKLFRTVTEEGAFGLLLSDTGSPICVTLERTFEDLRVVIPDGVHRCIPSTFNRGKPPYETYEIIVDGHDEVKFHRGNVETDSLGCILCGTTIGFFGDRPAVLGSAAGFAAFLLATGRADSFFLEVHTVHAASK